MIPTMLYADGRPRDVGTDRALANSLNQYVDRKSAHQSPWLDNAHYAGDNTGNVNDRIALRVIPVFFGTEHLSATVERFVTVAPWLRSATGGSAIFTITLSEMLPTYPPGVGFSDASFRPSFPGRFSQYTWTTTSTTWTTAAETSLSLGVKNLILGYAFLVLETNAMGTAECRGFAKFIESARVIA